MCIHCPEPFLIQKSCGTPNPQSLFARNPLLIHFVNDYQNCIGMSFSKQGI